MILLGAQRTCAKTKKPPEGGFRGLRGVSGSPPRALGMRIKRLLPQGEVLVPDTYATTLSIKGFHINLGINANNKRYRAIRR